MHFFRSRILFSFLFTLSSLTSGGAVAANVNWDDGAFLNKDWSNLLNWDPLGGITGDDLFIGNLPVAVGDSTIIDQDFSISSLTLTNGADADTSSNLLDVAGNIVISGAGSTFIASEHSSGSNGTSVTAHDITISGGGAYVLDGGITELNEQGAGSSAVVINANSFFSGYGSLLFLEDFGGTQTVQLFNDGTLQTRRPIGAINTERFTMHFTSTIGGIVGGTLLDLDGFTENGTVDIGVMTTLDLNVRHEEFNGTLKMGPGGIAEFATNLIFGQNANFTVDAETTLTGVPSVAEYRTRTHLESNAQINVNSGTLIFTRDVQSEPTTAITLASGTGLQFNDTTVKSVIDGNLNLSSSGTILTIDSEVDINDANFDWDGAEDATTTINSNGKLRINATDIEPGAGNAFDGTININNGGNLFTNIPGGWTFAGTMNINSFSGNPAIASTETMTVDGGQIVGTSGFALIDIPAVFTSNSAGGTSITGLSKMRFIQDVTFQGGSTHTGDGTIRFSGATFTINGNQTINMPNGIVNLDDDDTDSELFQLNADLTINADSLGTNNAFGDNADSSIDVISINNSSATLTINLTDPADEWILASGGLINITGAVAPSTSLAGSDLNIEGDIFIVDSTQFDSRFDLEATGLINNNSAGRERPC